MNLNNYREILIPDIEKLYLFSKNVQFFKKSCCALVNNFHIVKFILATPIELNIESLVTLINFISEVERFFKQISDLIPIIITMIRRN